MKIILISGHAQNGKDQTGIYLSDILEKEGYRVLTLHYADFLKHFLQKYLNWNGQKDSNGRTLLQKWGTDVVRKNNPNTWVDMMISLLKGIMTEYDYIIIPDTRFPNEIERVKEIFETITVRIERPNFDSGLSEEQKNHISEIALDKTKFNVTIVNSQDLNYLYKLTCQFANILIMPDEIELGETRIIIK